MNAKAVLLRSVSLLAALLTKTSAYSFDPLMTERGEATAACQFAPIASPLTMLELVSRTLCNNPRTREVWASVKAQAAAVGVARAAFFPSVTGSWIAARENSSSSTEGGFGPDAHSNMSRRAATVTLNWMLVDFGSRSSALHSATELLIAARAEEDATLQEVLAAAARDYADAQTASAAFDSATEVQRMMFDSMSAAQARVAKGLAPISDALQAQTQYEMSVSDVSRTEGELRIAVGTLATDMGLRPDEPIVLSPIEDASISDARLDESIAALIDDVRIAHPAVRAAEARSEAAFAEAKKIDADGLPTVSLVAQYSRNSQPATPGMGSASFPSTARDAYLGVQVSIPLFDGFSHHYQARKAYADAERQSSMLDRVRDKAALDTWTAWQSLRTATAQAAQCDKILSLAQQSFKAARYRYVAGVGDILELLNTQSSLSTAQQKRVESIGSWRKARVDLAASLGRLSVGNLAQPETRDEPGALR